MPCGSTVAKERMWRNCTPASAGSEARPWPPPRRVATLSVHTSPLHQPGTGDAGGMNVYIVEVARRLAEAGVEVEIFTRATSQRPAAGGRDGARACTVRHVTAGPFEGLAKEDLPGQLCAFTTGVLRAEAARAPGYYDLVHSHYWLSGQVGWLAKDRWGVPLVHTAHTLAKVKNAPLADGDRPEPQARVIGEEQVVAEADRLVANTAGEARELVDLYDADPRPRSPSSSPASTWTGSAPAGDAAARPARARRRLGLPERGYVVAFVGRIQPLKAPDVLLRAAAALRERDPGAGRAADRGDRRRPERHRPGPADRADRAGRARSASPTPCASCRRSPATTSPTLYRAADLVAVPSYNESFGLVALEAQACGTPVVAAAVGGLVTAVRDGVSGVLVDGHDPDDWARVLGGLLRGAGPPGRAGPRRRRSTPASSPGTARPPGCSRVYGEAVTEHREPAGGRAGGRRRAALGAGATHVVSAGRLAEPRSAALIEPVCAERELAVRVDRRAARTRSRCPARTSSRRSAT